MLTVAHYTTGASKWNPIEHRLFSEISKNRAGEPLDSYQKILNFIRSTRTQTGLSVTAHLDRRHYPTGTAPTPERLQALRLKPHEILPNCRSYTRAIWAMIPFPWRRGGSERQGASNIGDQLGASLLRIKPEGHGWPAYRAKLET